MYKHETLILVKINSLCKKETQCKRCLATNQSKNIIFQRRMHAKGTYNYLNICFYKYCCILPSGASSWSCSASHPRSCWSMFRSNSTGHQSVKDKINSQEG